MTTLYQKVPFNVGDDQPELLDEESVKSIIKAILQRHIDQVEDIQDDVAKAAKQVIANIHSEFSLQPCLGGHMDFAKNASWLLCCILKLTVFHEWVLDTNVSGYESLKDFSHRELVDYIYGLEGQGDSQAPENFEPSEATRKHGEDKSSDKMSSDYDKRVAVSYQDRKAEKLPRQEKSVEAAAGSFESSATTGNERKDKSDKLTPDDDKRAKAVGSHHS
ncbi:uncharacterized protein C2845_PM14G20340 [Panicum miliaceum]|uniref:Uncharacterized protein n=1 Tax=Panicum miliaceum TaxID=4540 RepID=A0A3L6PRJ3_PANMI|nr:uncharacterized protein C2845_PM14G20340 [Panicum miliaceum]